MTGHCDNIFFGGATLAVVVTTSFLGGRPDRSLLQHLFRRPFSGPKMTTSLQYFYKFFWTFFGHIWTVFGARFLVASETRTCLSVPFRKSLSQHLRCWRWFPRGRQRLLRLGGTCGRHGSLPVLKVVVIFFRGFHFSRQGHV